jgi:ATP-binding cassette subfamily B protein
MPEYMQEITTLVQTEGSAMSEIWLAGGFMLLCALGSLAGAVTVGFFAARIAASFSQRLRSMLFNKVDSFIMIFVFPKFRKMQMLIDNITRVTRENLTGLRVVRAYNAEKYQEEKSVFVN